MGGWDLACRINIMYGLTFNDHELYLKPTLTTSTLIVLPFSSVLFSSWIHRWACSGVAIVTYPYRYWALERALATTFAEITWKHRQCFIRSFNMQQIGTIQHATHSKVEQYGEFNTVRYLIWQHHGIPVYEACFDSKGLPGKHTSYCVPLSLALDLLFALGMMKLQQVNMFIPFGFVHKHRTDRPWHPEPSVFLPHLPWTKNASKQPISCPLIFETRLSLPLVLILLLNSALGFTA